MKQRYRCEIEEYKRELGEREGVWVVGGEDDRVIRVKDVRRVGEACRGKVRIVEECGHQVMVEKSRVVDGILREAVGEQEDVVEIR